MSDATLIFEIHQTGKPPRTEELALDIIKIGKLPSSHLRLDDPHVSRIHAVIERSKEGEVFIIDLGSSRGTMVNGQKVNKWKLSDGDEIQLGTTRIVFRAQASRPAAYDPEATQVGMMAPMMAASGFSSYGDDAATQIGLSAMPDDEPAPLRPMMSAAPTTRPSPVVSSPPVSAPISAPLASPSQGLRPMVAPKPAPVADQVYASASGGYSAEASGVSTQGWYDDEGNWHDGQGGWYDPEGNYHDAQGGWYDPEGNYFDAEGGRYDQEGNYFAPEVRIKDVDVYSESFLNTDYDSSGGGCLEVAFMWNDHVLALNQYKSPRDILIGDAPKNTFQIKDDTLPDPRFPVIKIEGRQPVLNFTTQMSGLFHIGEEQLTLDELVRSGRAQQGGFGAGSYGLPITPQTRARLGIGEYTILVHHAEVAKGVPIGGLGMDLGFATNMGVSFMLHAIFMFLVFFIPPGADDFSLDAFDINNRFVSQLIKPDEPEPEEEEPDWMKERQKEEEGAKAKEDEGKAGKKDETEKDKKMAIKGPSDNTEIKIAKDREKAYNTGALDVLSKNQITADWGSGQNTLGMQAITAMGDNNGSRIGDAFGVGAFGRTGAGRGGGGVSERGFGAGNIGTAGRSGGGGGGSDYGRNAGQIDERATLVPQVIPGRPVVSGSLDKEIIARVIRQHRNEIKYCYESELIKNKNLAGKVTVSFTISGTGAVVAATAAGGTLNSPAVSNCIASKVRRWVFPEPNGGGIVKVSYPFVFAPQQ